MIVPVILSGGEGRRLWPLSSPDRPKQFLALTGDETLLQQTVRRLAVPGVFAPPIIIGGAGQRFLIAEQLRAADLTAGRIVLEPKGRNTAPALAVGALIAAAGDPDALILSAHADAAIPDADAFRAAVALGAPAAEAGHLVLFGIKPSFPATGYGYIQPGAAIDENARQVARFLEKPSAERAEALIAAGALWNSGIFLMRASALIAEFETHAPQVLAQARASLDAAVEDSDFLRLDEAAFAASPSIAIDHAVFEPTTRAAVVAADFAWSDIGSWSAVWDVQDRDAAGNATRGPTVLEDVAGCLVFSDGPRVAACGVTGLVIVATAERVLVLPRDRDQQVRLLAERAEGG
ncbi:MAG TPA: mannose-1-phosphate guanylyltransferase/mannose-6-phosphate isomerase [Caulobacteraceae bacterium]|jgi:mannose-1-phosphate guanylyltransferase/mannose-1-phosphate guanylyltransferase/mannose-6-phosphate isomerase|nr:mannose-1-phosphate guanylyltransferase/mannose-6-phosphate isomerase [Caulobacteraceae bacterium]